MILVYTKDNCPHCVKAKTLLQVRGLEYSEVVIGKDITREEFMEAFPNARTVPQIIFDNKNIGGYEELVQKLK
jgi:glutaredoxin 3